jgi:hypothetical protein
MNSAFNMLHYSILAVSIEKRCEVAGEDRYVPTEREQAFLDTIENPKYDRDIINGLKPFFEDKAPADIKAFYTADA